MDFGKRIKEKTEGTITENREKVDPNFKPEKEPNWIKVRDQYFEELYENQKKVYSNANKRDIIITLNDGKEIKGISFETTSLDIAKKISKKLANNSIVAKIKYSKKDINIFNNLSNAEAEFFDTSCENKSEELYDLNRPLEGDCTLQLLTFDDEEAKTVFWHSSAHILGRSMEGNYGALLTHGPPIENGFFYDSFIGEEKVNEKVFNDLQKKAEELIKEDKPFKRLVVSKNEAIKLFNYNPFKIQLITKKIPENSYTTVYKCGNLIDLCTGPHVITTGKIKAFKVFKSSGSFWLGNTNLDKLQRVYGKSFPTKKELDNHIKMLEELAKRDHRNLGEVQNLFVFNKLSPGSTFFMPNGIKIINRIWELLRKEYKIRGIQEVCSPNIFKNELWKTSGHYYKYKDNMFYINIKDEGQYGVKPMNCPAHCLMFKNGLHSYRNLPIRYADFGVLHRNELSGALSGLTRVRRFVQDDAHFFCRDDQIIDEILDQLDLIDYIYKIFNFEYKLELSTKPELHMGDDKIWETAEKSLVEALEKSGKDFKINPGDGAFYGPKIDIKVLDCYKREHQLATIQLDFNLPERFDLKYKTNEDTHIENNENKEVNEEDNKKEKEDKKLDDEVVDIYSKTKKLKHGFKRPIIIHRAVLGSIERCIGILCEHFGGKWPFWMSPKQIMVIPVSEKFIDYAIQVKNRFELENYYAEVDYSSMGIKKKIRNAQLEQFNFSIVVGEKEVNEGTVTVRERDAKKEKGTYKISEFLNDLKKWMPEKSNREKKLIEESYFNKNENLLKENMNDEKIKILNERLSFNPFLGGENISSEDKDNYEKLKDLDLKFYPNLFKWKIYMKKFI